jgi:hypothetical protein
VSALRPIAERRIRTEAVARWLGLLSALASLIVPSRGAAQVPPVADTAQSPHASLVVTRGEGAEDCPDAAGLREQVQRVAGAGVLSTGMSSATANDTWIQVVIVHNFGGYRAEISAGGLHRGRRTLEDLGPSCASLADAVAITIAIFLDPYATSPAPRATPARVAAPAAAKAKRVSSWTPRLTIELSAGAAVSVLSHTEPQAAASVGLRISERWSLALGGAFVFPDALSFEGGQIDLGLSYALLLACGRALGGAEGARVDWCAAPLLGSLRGSGRGYTSHQSERALWSALAVGPDAVFPFSRSLAWTLGVLGVLPLVRQGFDVENAGVRSNAFRSSAVAALFTLGVRGEL